MTAGSSSSRGNKEIAKRYYSESKFSDAIKEYTLLIDSIDTDHPELHIFLSNRSACYMQITDYKNALDDGEMCKSLKPTWFKGYSRQGSALIALNRHREAVYALEKALELEPSSNDVKVLLANARRRAGISSSSSSSYDDNGSQGQNGEYGSLGGQSFGDLFNIFTNFIKTQFAKYVGMLGVATSEQRMMIGGVIAFGIYMLYKLIFASSSYYNEDEYYYEESSYPQYGLPWNLWLAIIAAAWKVPPLLPIGEYALPFFGLSFWTFTSILRMLTGGQHFGGGGGGGMFGGGRRRNRF
jgi:tetratricopeptide (TPR) repeat protein